MGIVEGGQVQAQGTCGEEGKPGFIVHRSRGIQDDRENNH